MAEGGRDRIQANPAHPPVAMDQPLPVNVVEQPAAQEHGGQQQHEIGGGLDGQQGPVGAQLNRLVRESSRKKVRPSRREGKKLVKRLRKGVSNKRVSKVKKRYSVSFSDKLGFKVPSIDFPMYMLLQKKLGSSASKTNINEAEKVLYKS